MDEILQFYMKILSLTLVEKQAIEREFKSTNDRIDKLKKEKESTLKHFNTQQNKQKKEMIELEENTLHIQSDLKVSREAEKSEKEEIDRTAEKRKQQSEITHQNTMQELLERKHSLQMKLSEVVEQNKDVEKNLQREEEDLELHYSHLIETHLKLKQEKKSAIDKEINWANAEREEFDDLQAHFNLVDKNIKVGLDEEETVNIIKQMEIEANKILDSSAVQVQRLFRGRRDRALVAKLKQKKSKGKKGKKKGKK